MSTVGLHGGYILCTITDVRNIITPQKYTELSEDEQFYYDPVYKKYKVKKVRNYQECDLGHTHFMGWVEERTPIGEPHAYKRDNSLSRQTMKLMGSTIVDELDQSNVLMTRVLANKKKWSD